MTTPEIPSPADLAKAEIAELYQASPEQEQFVDYTIRKHLLSAFALLDSGRELQLAYGHSDSLNHLNPIRTLSLSQQLDRMEVSANYPLRRHEWAHELQDGVTGKDRWVPFLKRMHDLKAQDERDFELEQATVEIGSLFIMGSDENGNRMITYSQVRSDEIYKLSHDKKSLSGVNNPPQKQDNVIGFPMSSGSFAYGEWLGFHSANAERWYVVSDGYATPLETITYVGSAWTGEDNKFIGVEYKDRPIVAA